MKRLPDLMVSFAALLVLALVSCGNAYFARCDLAAPAMRALPLRPDPAAIAADLAMLDRAYGHVTADGDEETAAAIRGLSRRLGEKERHITALERQLDLLRRQNADLRQRLSTPSRAAEPPPTSASPRRGWL